MLYRVAKFHDKTRTVSDRGALLATYETKTQTLRDLPYTTTKASLSEKQNEKKARENQGENTTGTRDRHGCILCLDPRGCGRPMHKTPDR